MLTTKASFERKPVTLEASDCIIEKTVRLSGAEYDSFAKCLTADRDFIKENAGLMRVDSEGRTHCLLVLGDDRRDRILVNSEGASYARYAALLPNAGSLETITRFPALAELNKTLSDIAEYIMNLALDFHREDRNKPRTVIDMGFVSDTFGVDWRVNDEICATIREMLVGLDGADLVQMIGSELTIRWKESEPDVLLTSDASTLAGWQEKVEANPARWREDERFRKADEGALYYIGGEDGQYMWAEKDGRLTAGHYDHARPGIENAVRTYTFTQRFGSYEEASAMALRLGGERFAADIFGEADRLASLINKNRGRETVRSNGQGTPKPDVSALLEAAGINGTGQKENAALAEAVSGMEDYMIERERASTDARPFTEPDSSQTPGASPDITAEADKEFTAWMAVTESSRYTWTEDEIVRLNGRGAMYYIGGEDGNYMSIGNDGTLDVGSYIGAVPHIGEAIFTRSALLTLGSFDSAFEHAVKLGGKKFLADLFSAPDKNEIVRAAWKKMERESNGVNGTGHQDGYTSVLKTIEDGKKSPKPPRKKAEDKQKRKGDDAL